MSKATISIYAPPMKVNCISMKLRRTDVEPMTAEIQFEDFTGLLIRKVIIPETYVRRLGFLRWMVDACKGDGADVSGRVEVWLPEEPVVREGFYMVAKAIDSPTTLTLANGEVWKGSVKFPDCKCNIFTGIAEEVTAIGELVKQ